MKKVLFLEQFANISGGQRVLINILDGIDREKIFPIVCIPTKGDLSRELDKHGIQYKVISIGNYNSGRKNLLDFIAYSLRLIYLIPSLAIYVKKEKINLIYANAPRTFVLAALVAKLASIPVIWHLHSILRGIELKSCTILSKYVNKIIAVSNAAAVSFIRENITIKNKIQIVYNGIDMEKYNKSETDVIRKELNISNEATVVAFIGQLARWKGIELFIRAAQAITKDNQQVYFLIIGDTLFNKTGKKYKQYLTSLIDNNKRIINLGKKDNVEQILNEINIYVLPSIEPDPFPLTVLEAMASQKAVVVSDHGGPIEVIRDQENGIVFKSGDINDLSYKIAQLISHPEIIKELGGKARATIENNYSLQRMQKEINLIIETI